MASAGAVRAAVKQLASDIREGAESLSLKSVRRLVEKQLGLAKGDADPHKGLIGQLVDELLNGEDTRGEEGYSGPSRQQNGGALGGAEEVGGEGEDLHDGGEKVGQEEGGREGEPRRGSTSLKPGIRRKPAETDARDDVWNGIVRGEDEDDGAGEGGEEVEEDEGVQDDDDEFGAGEEEDDEEEEQVRKRKQKKEPAARNAKRQKVLESGRPKKKRSVSTEEEEDEGDGGEERDDGEGDGELDDEEEDGDEGPKKRQKGGKQKKATESGRAKGTGPKKESTARGGSALDMSASTKKLKDIVQAAGLRIPPQVYKRVRGVPEEERDAAFAEELEGMLERHGLSRHSSEKQIKSARRKIERDRDMEGIDTSNIIVEPRGRRTRQTRHEGGPVGQGRGGGVEEDDDDDEGDGATVEAEEKGTSDLEDDDAGGASNEEEDDEEGDEDEEDEEEEDFEDDDDD